MFLALREAGFRRSKDRVRYVTMKVRLIRRLRCEGCGLIYLLEEAYRGRFSLKQNKCARCIIKIRGREGSLLLPDCFGKSYSGLDPMCVERCNLREGCVIEYADGKITDLDFSLGLQKRPTVKQLLLRILRFLAKPVHAYDLAPILQKMTNGRFSMRRKHWYAQIVQRLRETPHVFALGDGFFVWDGAWSEDRFDEILYPRRPATDVDSILEQIRRDALEKAEEITSRFKSVGGSDNDSENIDE